MDEFKSLTKCLDGYFDCSLADLPDDLRQSVIEVLRFRPAWDDLSENQRRSLAVQSDFENDPGCENGRQRLFNLHLAIAETKRAQCPTASDLEIRDRRIEMRELELERVNAELHREAFRRWGVPLDFQANSRPNSVRGQNNCQCELEGLMKKNPSPLQPKSGYRADLCEKHDISERAFDRAWSNAILATGNLLWGQAGRRRKNQRT